MEVAAFRPLQTYALQLMIGLLATNMALAQDLIDDPQFNSGIAGWRIERLLGPPAPIVAVTHDTSAGSPTAPSLNVRQIALGPAMQFDAVNIWSACVPITTGQNFDFSFDVKRSDPFFSTLSVKEYGDSACATSALRSTAPSCSAIGTGWDRCSIANYSTSTNSYVQLVVHQVLMRLDAPGPLIEVQIDNVRFGPTGTVPVSLQAFSID